MEIKWRRLPGLAQRVCVKLRAQSGRTRHKPLALAGAVRGAAALTLAGILGLATLVAGLAAAVALAGIHSFASVLFDLRIARLGFGFGLGLRLRRRILLARILRRRSGARHGSAQQASHGRSQYE